MKLYRLGPLDEGDEFFPTKKAAIARAKDYDLEYGYVVEHEIGRLTKTLACALASGRGYSRSHRTVWTNEKLGMFPPGHPSNVSSE